MRIVLWAGATRVAQRVHQGGRRCSPSTCATPSCSATMPEKGSSDADPPGTAAVVSSAVARVEPAGALRTSRREIPELRPTAFGPAPLPAGWAMVRCGRPNLAGPRGRAARWPDLVEATRFRTTRVVLATAHLDSVPRTTGSAIFGRSASAVHGVTLSDVQFSAATANTAFQPSAKPGRDVSQDHAVQCGSNFRRARPSSSRKARIASASGA